MLWSVDITGSLSVAPLRLLPDMYPSRVIWCLCGLLPLTCGYFTFFWSHFVPLCVFFNSSVVIFVVATKCPLTTICGYFMFLWNCFILLWWVYITSLCDHLVSFCSVLGFLLSYNYHWKTSIISVSMKKRDGKENPHIHCDLISHMDLFFLWLEQISFDLHLITAEQLANLQLPVMQKTSKSLREMCQMSSMHVTLWTGLFLAHCLGFSLRGPAQTEECPLLFIHAPELQKSSLMLLLCASK